MGLSISIGTSFLPSWSNLFQVTETFLNYLDFNKHFQRKESWMLLPPFQMKYYDFLRIT